MNNSSALGIIGKALSGAASVAVPMALEEHRARIQALRDERLQQYRSKEIEGQQNLQRELSAAQIEATRAEGKASRDQQATLAREEMEQRRSEAGARERLESERIALARDQLNLTRSGQEIADKIAKLNLQNARDQRRLQKILMDPNADPKDRRAAIEYINVLAGKGSKFKVQPIKSKDEFGLETTGGFLLYDDSTGISFKIDPDKLQTIGDDAPTRKSVQERGDELAAQGMNEDEVLEVLRREGY